MPDAPPPELTLLLLATEAQFPALARVEQMTWTDAEMSGFGRFGLFDRIIATPPEFPAPGRDHHRPEMVRALRRRIEGGAHTVFLVPPFSKFVPGPKPEPISSFHRADDVLRETTGARIRERPEPKAVPLVFDSAAPPALEAFLRRYPPDVVVRVPRDPLGLEPQIPHIHLAGFARIQEDPCVVAGFPGDGMWLVLPWNPHDFDEREIFEVLALLDDTADLRTVLERRWEAARNAQRRSTTATTREFPTPDSAIGGILELLQRAGTGFTTVAAGQRTDIRRLRDLGIRIESARDARARGASVPKGVIGYRIRPPE